MRIFVAGTDTGAGKTFVASKLVAAMNAAGHPCVGFKPIACGDRDDAIALREAGVADVELDRVNPIWLRTPAAPLIAGRIENRSVELERLMEGYHWLANRFEHIVIEGAGGWLTPLTAKLTMASLAITIGAPVLLVAANRLGALNHTLLTLESIRRANLPVTAVILNNVTSVGDVASETNTEVIREIVDPVLVCRVEKGAGKLPETLLCKIGIHSVKI